MKKILLISLILLISTGCKNQINKTDSVRITFINVGKADAILIQSKDENYLIDTGTEKSTEQLDEVFKLLMVDKLKAVFLTHGDKDHIGGFDFLAKNYQIAKLYISGKGEIMEKDIPYQAEGYGIPYETLSFLDKLTLTPSLSVKVLAPKNEFEEENDNSLVLILNCFNRRILLTGDILDDGEKAILVTGEDLSADILKVAHHGQDDSTSQEFINRVKPSYCIISTDTEERESSASQEVIDRLGDCEVYITEDYKLGISFIIDDKGNITVEDI